MTTLVYEIYTFIERNQAGDGQGMGREARGGGRGG